MVWDSHIVLDDDSKRLGYEAFSVGNALLKLLRNLDCFDSAGGDWKFLCVVSECPVIHTASYARRCEFLEIYFLSHINYCVIIKDQSVLYTEIIYANLEKSLKFLHIYWF
jgi:hypothetical protein